MFIHFPLDEPNYVSAGMECELGENGKGIEPFIYKHGNSTVERYLSRGFYVVKKDNKIIRVIETTKRGGGYDIYVINNDQVVQLESESHRCSMNRMYVIYTDGRASKILVSGRVFGGHAIGDMAPLLIFAQNDKEQLIGLQPHRDTSANNAEAEHVQACG
jgi:hypothetical protein